MDGGVVFLGLLLLAAASKMSTSPEAMTTERTQDSIKEMEIQFPSGDLAPRPAQLNLPVVEPEDQLNLPHFSDIPEIVNETIDESTTVEPPLNADTITDKNNNSQDTVVVAANGAYSFRFHAEPLPWLGAVRACWRRGGRLATPHTPHEARALGALLRTAAPAHPALHVGVSDLAWGHWTTLQGKSPSAAGYDAWLGNHSSVSNRPSCAALLPNGLYIRSRCGAIRPFACEMPVLADDYVQLPGLGHYRLHQDPLPWLEAMNTCRDEGASLVVPSSPLEAGFLAGALIFKSEHASVREHGVFVGIADYANENDWQTVAGRRTNDYYNSWSSEGNHDGIEGRCAVLKPTGRYEMHPCEEPLAFCCKRTRFLGNSESDGEYRTIPGVGMYRLHKHRRTWFDALLQCHKENASLALPHTEEAAQELTAWINAEVEGSPYFHVGYHDIDGDGTFEMISENPDVTYNKWWNGYPTRNGDLCVSMGKRVFFNYPCNKYQEYFCEKYI